MVGNETLVKHMCTRTRVETQAYLAENNTCQVRYVMTTVTEHCEWVGGWVGGWMDGWPGWVGG